MECQYSNLSGAIKIGIYYVRRPHAASTPPHEKRSEIHRSREQEKIETDIHSRVAFHKEGEIKSLLWLIINIHSTMNVIMNK